MMARQRPNDGYTLIELLAVVAVIGILVALLLPAVQSAREVARRANCMNNLRQIGLAAAAYQESHGVFPFGVGGGGPSHLSPGIAYRWSAQSQLLPYMDQEPLFNSLNFSFIPWSHSGPLSLANATAVAVVISAFLCPSDADTIGSSGVPVGHNNYRACGGSLPYNILDATHRSHGRNDGIFWYQSAVSPAHVRDGMSQTAAFSERCLGTPLKRDRASDYYVSDGDASTCSSIDSSTAVRYTRSNEWSGQRWSDGNAFYTRYLHILEPNKASCTFGEWDYDGPVVVTASSRHPGGVHLLAADGSVRFAKDTVERSVWKAIGTAAGGEIVDTGQEL